MFINDFNSWRRLAKEQFFTVLLIDLSLIEQSMKKSCKFYYLHWLPLIEYRLTTILRTIFLFIQLKINVLPDTIKRSRANDTISTRFIDFVLIEILEFFLSYNHSLNLVKFKLVVIRFRRRYLRHELQVIVIWTIMSFLKECLGKKTRLVHITPFGFTRFLSPKYRVPLIVYFILNLFILILYK
jgi:hypothetical protein